MAEPIQKYLEEYKTLLRFRSISADPVQKKSVAACANWIHHFLKKAGMSRVNLFSTGSHPVVYAEHTIDPRYKTILFYGHYDVQPAGPLAQWKYPPFEPVVHDNYIYARGASDDKGQLFIQLKAIEQVLKNRGLYRVNIKCVYEGEEETGSQHLGAFMRTYRQLLKSDVVVVSDTKMLAANRPAITYSLRGSINAELVVTARRNDLHSGTYGGMVYDPAAVLSKLLAGLHTKSGRVAIPGFYDTAKEVNAAERFFMRQNGPPDAVLLSESGSGGSHGESGYSNYERTTIRPSVTITSLLAGHTGEGFKNSIAASAKARLNIRLADMQEPPHICRLLHSFVRSNMPAHCSYTLRFSGLTPPVETNRSNIYMRAAAGAYEQVFGNPLVFLRSGGTIPVVSLMQHEMNVPVVLMGFALGSDNMHAANERFYLPTIERGIHTIIAFAKQVASL